MSRAHRRPASAPTCVRRSPADGFTLIELTITLFVLAVVLVGVLSLFDLAGNVSRVQVDIADMQQTLRSSQYDMVRLLRSAGRGNVPIQVAQPPLPAPAPQWSLPLGVAISVDNNVPEDTFVDVPVNTRRVLENTDVLTIRGVLSSPVYTVVQETFTVEQNALDPDFGTGSFDVIDLARPGVPVPQNLAPLIDAIQNDRPEALIIVSPLDDSFHHVVELVPDNSVVTPARITVAFRFRDGSHTDAYWALSGGDWDAPLNDAAYMGILEEHRFYVEDVRENPADETSPPRPRLMSARVYPGTQTPWGDNPANWATTVGDNVYDLQIALGIETGGADPFEPAEDGTANDEWLYNFAGDDDTENRWRFGRLYYVRMTTSTFAERRDRLYRTPPGATIEDHVYLTPEPGTPNALIPDRSFRRRSLRTVVDLRNLS
jgi:prepilin-type N-terminal cleavage/methylation domain-containing protein